MASFRPLSKRTLIVLLILPFVVGSVYAQRRGAAAASKPDRLSIVLEAGPGFLERGDAMVDLKGEVQFSLTPKFRLGLGFGFMNASGHEDGRGRGYMGGREMMPMSGLQSGLFSAPEIGRDIHAYPISLSLYYVLPMGRRWDIFLTGGGDFYFGSFRLPSETLKKNAWGGRAGLGFDFRLAEKVRLVAEGGYRFAEFCDLTPSRDRNLLTLFGGLIGRMMEGSDSGMSGLLGYLERMLQPKPVDVDFNGFSVRAGVKLGL